jgi:HNH endonuclease/AP2 domain
MRKIMLTQLTQVRLVELLDYDPNTGEFRWKVDRTGGTKAGDIAGTLRPKGYMQISIDGVQYLAHRLAWLYVHGAWPPDEVDHIDTVRNNNCIANLRLATSHDNNGNQSLSPRNTSGLKGVSWHKHAGKWIAQITIGKPKTLGYFDNKQDAHAAYMTAAQAYFGKFARAA